MKLIVVLSVFLFVSVQALPPPEAPPKQEVSVKSEARAGVTAAVKEAPSPKEVARQPDQGEVKSESKDKLLRVRAEGTPEKTNTLRTEPEAAKPAPGAKEAKPALRTEEAKPAPGAPEAKPALRTEEAKPAPGAEKAKPALRTEDAKPGPKNQEAKAGDKQRK